MGDSVIIKSTDVSAPSLTSSIGVLITMLRAVLVDGFGSTDGLGWTMPYISGDYHRAVFRNSEEGSGTFFLIEDNLATIGMASIKAYEQMSDVDTGIMPLHDVSLSGTLKCVYGPASIQTATPWWVIGDSLGVWIVTMPFNYLGVGMLGYRSCQVVYIGDYSKIQLDNHYNSCILAPYKTAAQTIADSAQIGVITSALTTNSCFRLMRSYNLLSGSVDGCVRIGYASGGTQHGAVTAGTELCYNADGVQYTCPAFIGTANNVMGVLPGLRSPLQLKGIDGTSVTSVNQTQKDYKYYTFTDHVEHFFPFSQGTLADMSYLVLTSGKGFRNDFA